MSNFGDYTGKELLELNLTKRDWLVEKLIREKDSIILVGDAKAGKSLLKQQLCCSLTSQHPFLDKFHILRPCNVVDIQLEGELEDTQDRYKRILESIDFEPSRYHLIFERPMELAHILHLNHLIERIERLFKGEKPDIIFIDPVYFAFSGGLSDDVTVRAFLGNIRVLKDRFSCTICLVHHTHKLRINYRTGEILDEGDEAMFGSTFFRAFTDHVLLFVYDRKNNIRIMSCTTQRSGEIAEQTKLRLIQPKPLYFEEIEKEPTREAIVLHWIAQKPSGMDYEEIAKHTGLGRNTIYLSLKELIKTGQVTKTETRPVFYSKKGTQ